MGSSRYPNNDAFRVTSRLESARSSTTTLVCRSVPLSYKLLQLSSDARRNSAVRAVVVFPVHYFSPLPYWTVYSTLSHYHPPLGRFFQVRLLDNQDGANSTNSANTERYVFGKLSDKDAANADLLGTDTIPTMEISSMENRPGRGGGGLHRRVRYTTIKFQKGEEYTIPGTVRNTARKTVTGDDTKMVFKKWNSRKNERMESNELTKRRSLTASRHRNPGPAALRANRTLCRT